MPDDNRFAGLSDKVEDDGDGADESATDADTSPSTEVEYESSDLAADADTGTDPTDDDGTTDDDSDDPAAFPFDATEKKTAYVRPETLAELEDARALVDAQLRTDHDVRDLTGREFYDAVFRLAADDTEGLIEAILEAREE